MNFVGEARTADSKDHDGHEQLRARQIKLIQRRRSGGKGQQNDAVPNHARLEQAGNMFFHIRRYPPSTKLYRL